MPHATQKPRASVQAHRSTPSEQTIVVVGPRNALMAKQLQQASPYRQPRVEFQKSPQALLATYVETRHARRPALYVLVPQRQSTSSPRDKVCQYPVRDAQQQASAGHAQYLPWIDALRAIQGAQPTTPVLVVTDDGMQASWDSFLEAGADELITPAALQNPAVAKRRIESAFAHARVEGLGASAVVEADNPLTEDQIADGLAKVRAAVTARPQSDDRGGLLSELLAITAPELRAASGRLDAKRIAQWLDLSLNAFAVGMPVSREALRSNPDSKRLQSALDPYARVQSALATLLPGDGGRQWLNTPHPRFGSTPLAAMVAGRADDVARLLELAREGDVD